MSEIQEIQNSALRPSASERLLSFTRVRLPAWATLALLAFREIPAWKDDIDFWLNVTRHSGGFFAVIATAIESPFFTPVLGVASALYLVLVRQPKGRPIQRHPIWATAIWCIFLLCLAAVAATAISGFFELKMREAYDQGRAGVPRGAVGENNLNTPQTPFVTGNWGTISPDQMRILIQELPKLPTKQVFFFSVPNDNGGWQYWHQFNDVFQRSGISAPRGDQMPRGPQEEGLMLEVRDKNNIPESAQKMLEAFAMANIDIQVIDAPKDFLNPAWYFAIFIGPAPIRWR
jgi:hypothetical protein